MSAIRFPGESSEYRAARDALLAEEIALRAQVAEIAARRAELPPGGAVKKDYRFVAPAEGGGTSQVALADLFTGDRDALFVYGLMYGPDKDPCPMCCSFLDALDGNARHLAERLDLVVVSRSPVERTGELGRARGWRNLRLLSSAGSDFPADYHLEGTDGAQLPMANVFVRDGGATRHRIRHQIRHHWGSEMLYADLEGQPRHMDQMWPLWNVLDTVPAGRGTDWYPV